MKGRVSYAEIEYKPGDCYCSVPELYTRIAERLGYNPEHVQYDCKSVHVNSALRDEIYSFYRHKQSLYDEQIAALWAIYGPKADLLQPKRIVARIYDGFIIDPLED